MLCTLIQTHRELRQIEQNAVDKKNQRRVEEKARIAFRFIDVHQPSLPNQPITTIEVTQY
jgi:hypothetical protein